MTKKRQTYYLRNKEKRDSRIKDTRKFIIEKASSSLLNNQKWYQIFEFIELCRSEFELKTLLSSDLKKASNIFELEQNSLLIDNSGDFIDFLELEKVTLKNTSELTDELKKLNVEFLEKSNRIEIHGYRN